MRVSCTGWGFLGRSVLLSDRAHMNKLWVEVPENSCYHSNTIHARNEMCDNSFSFILLGPSSRQLLRISNNTRSYICNSYDLIIIISIALGYLTYGVPVNGSGPSSPWLRSLDSPQPRSCSRTPHWLKDQLELIK